MEDEEEEAVEDEEEQEEEEEAVEDEEEEAVEEAEDVDKDVCPPSACKQPRQKRIACDACNQWYHGFCVGINAKQAKLQPTWLCSTCKVWLLSFRL